MGNGQLFERKFQLNTPIENIDNLHSSNKRNSLLLKKGPPPGIWP